MSARTTVSFLFGIAFALNGFALVAGQQVDGQEKPPVESSATDSPPSEPESTAPKANEVAKPVPAGRAVSRSYEFAEAEKRMTYRLYLPKSYYERLEENKEAKFPLIVALHGYGSNPTQIVGYPEFARHANENHCIIVAPMGYNTTGWYGGRGSGGGRGSDPKNLGELSEKDVMNVLELTRQEFPVDENRIYLYGHSMGGGGAIYLGAKYPEIWAAIAPMAPAIPTVRVDLEKAKHIPVFMVHGDKDRLLPVEAARRWVGKLKKAGVPHQYIEVEGGDHISVAFNYFDEIFEFFEQNPKRPQPAAESQPPPTDEQTSQ
ncbi:MAG: alpha/beta hydrolase-fold protein [Pirellulaceae bacterium]|nr:alpha/beta hydrolase-fold protein [Pirellulaceae bacterium]